MKGERYDNSNDEHSTVYAASASSAPPSLYALVSFCHTFQVLNIYNLGYCKAWIWIRFKPFLFYRIGVKVAQGSYTALEGFRLPHPVGRVIKIFIAV